MKWLLVSLFSLTLLTGCDPDFLVAELNSTNNSPDYSVLTAYLEHQGYIEEGDIGVVRPYQVDASYEYYLVEHSGGQYMVRFPASDTPLNDNDIQIVEWDAVAETPYERKETQRQIRRTRRYYRSTVPVGAF